MIHSKISTSVKGQDQVDRIRAQLKLLKNSYVTIGVHDGAGSYQDGPEVVEVALWMEYGTARGIPPRSYVGQTIDENAGLLNQWREELISKILAGTTSVQQALETVGFRIQVLIQNKIKSNVPPPLNKEYAARKIADGLAPVTLIRTGLLLRSVTYRVHIND